MEKKSEPASSAGAAPSEPVKTSVHSDLQYVSIQVDGSTYGGWYRVLPDGQMELLALANMHCERRSESTPIEQARGMLSDFITGVRRKPPAANAAPGTLGALLYADTTKKRVSERDWAGLLQSVAVGNAAALRELHERTHRVVFTLLVRLTGKQAIAEALTLDVFHDVWRQAAKYDPKKETVLGWIMNYTRSRAIDYLGLTAARDADQDRQSYWPTDVLCPSQALWQRLAERLALTTSNATHSSNVQHWAEPEWEDVAPGITCKLLATDAERHRVSMLVRLAPGTDYPPHSHAGVEELHMLQGELWIDDRNLFPGDYNRAEPGTADKRVWSETGCMGVLITSTRDAIS